VLFRSVKVTTSGTFTEYPLPTADGGPASIAAGPDGNMWFTENNSNKVARVTTTGVFTEYPVPTTDSHPSGIAAGPDGNMWFTENFGNKVAKVTTTGAFTEYPIPTALGYPIGITAGPDGNLWISGSDRIPLVSMTTAGAFTQYPLPSNVYEVQMTVGPDGNLWFTENFANNVAKLLLQPTPPAAFNPMSPLRVLDTRTTGQTLAENGSLTLTLGGSGVPDNATAVTLNVTVTNTSAPGFLTLYPMGTGIPIASNLNWIPGETVANLVQVALGLNRSIVIYNSAGSTDVVADLEGYFAPPIGGTKGQFVALPPDRITDTRTGSGRPNEARTLGPGGTLDVQVGGVGGVPASGIEAVVLNATVTNTTAAGYLTAYPKGLTLPLASNLNWTLGTTVPNRLVITVGAGGVISFYNSDGNTDLIVDVNGYFTDASATGSNFVPVSPSRILDTRDGTGGFGSPVGPSSTIAATVAGQWGVPSMSDATPPKAVVLNVTATNVTAATFLTVWPDLTSQSPASDLNVLPGQSVPNLVVVKVGSDGKVDVYNGWGSTDVILDIIGWYG
jgi:hypothetical protein